MRTDQQIVACDRFPGPDTESVFRDAPEAYTAEEIEVLRAASEQLAVDLDVARSEFARAVADVMEMPCDDPPPKRLPRSKRCFGLMDEGDVYAEIGKLVGYCELLKAVER